MDSVLLKIQDYLKNSFAFNDDENALLQLFTDWLPEKIVDSHVHCNLSSHIINFDDFAFQQVFTTFPYFSIGQSRYLKSRFFPRKVVGSFRFSNPTFIIDRKKANKYLVDNCPKGDRIALVGLPDDISYTLEMLKTGRFNALKMYKLFKNIPVTLIYQFFKPELLTVAQERRIPIILHLPLPIHKSKDDLFALLNDFPDLIVVLAHLGVPNGNTMGLREIYEELAKHKNLYLDTAMIVSKEIMSMSISVFGHEKILFGTDEPLNLIRATVYQHPELGERMISDYRYHWIKEEDLEEYQEVIRPSNIIHMHWQSLLAIKSSLEELTLDSASVKEDIFYKNAKNVFGFDL